MHHGARVVLVSLGTTGTHAVYHALTYLGLPAAHFHLASAALRLGEPPSSREQDLSLVTTVTGSPTTLLTNESRGWAPRVH